MAMQHPLYVWGLALHTVYLTKLPGRHIVQYHTNTALIALVNIEHVDEDDEIMKKMPGIKWVN